jgi:hypothetical protein
MQKRPKPPPRRTAQEWRKLVDRWTHSGQSADVFADKHQLSKRSLSWWRWRLRTASRTPTPSTAPAEMAFVPLVVSSRAPTESTAEARWVLETADVRVEMSGAAALVIEGLGVALERVRGKE